MAVDRMTEQDLSGLVALSDFEKAARERVATMGWEYMAGGAGDELTLARNRAALEAIRLKPRVLRDVTRIDTRTTLFGREHRMPVLLAPTGYHRVFHPEGECETARGAAQAGVTMVVSTVATTSLEDVARTNDSPRWFQVYVQRDREWTRRQIALAEECGYQAFMLTVDTPVLGSRDREKRAGFQMPSHLKPRNFPPLPEGVSDHHHDLHSIYNPFLDAALNWKDVAWLRSITRLPVLLKGVLAPEDARLAVEHGASGVVVSNHGGRNLDTVPASIEALPAVVKAVGGRIPVLMDGGIRRGTDVIKALALGADAVMIGRPYLHGLAVAGAAGVARVVELLHLELMSAMALMGLTSIAEIDGDALWPE
jgi:4-hydroxymandelate oxidase